MGRGLRTGVARVLISIAIVVAGGIAWLGLRTAQYESDRREAEWASLTRSLKTVEGGAVPESWTSGIFVSQRGLNSILALSDGMTVAFDPMSRKDDTVLTVQSVRLEQWQIGFPVGKIDLIAESKSRGLRVRFRGDATLLLNGIDVDADGKPIARFGLQLLQLQPDVEWYSLRFGLRGYASELLATGTAVWLAKALRFDVPLPDRLAVELGRTRTERVGVRDPKEENWVDLTATIPEGRLQEEVSYSPPAFIGGGMWLGARRQAGGQMPLEPVTRGSRTDQQLDAEIHDARAKLAKVKGPASGTADVAVWVDGNAVGGLVQKIAATSAEQRTVTIKSSSYKGRLAYKEWRDNILGKGGAFVEFNKPDAVRASVLLEDVSATWQARGGMMVGARARLMGTADIHVHIDPLVGGGVGTNVGMIADAGVQAAGRLDVVKATVGARTALALVPRMECRVTSFTLKTDGKVTGDWGWTKVPSVGARVETTELNSMLSVQILLSDEPHVLQGRDADDQPIPLKAGGDILRVTPSWKSAKVSLRPLASDAGDRGLLIAAAIEVATSAERDEGAKARREAEEKFRTDIVDTLKPTECPGRTTIAVTIGDIEIGPNHEVVKFLRNAWNDITKGPGKNNEVVKILKSATDAMAAAGQPIDDVTKGILNEVNGLAGKTFGENSEAAKAVNLATAIARPPSVGKNEDGGITATLPGGTSVSTGGGHGGLGVTVQTPVFGKMKF